MDSQDNRGSGRRLIRDYGDMALTAAGGLLLSNSGYDALNVGFHGYAYAGVAGLGMLVSGGLVIPAAIALKTGGDCLARIIRNTSAGLSVYFLGSGYSEDAATAALPADVIIIKDAFFSGHKKNRNQPATTPQGNGASLDDMVQ